MRRNPHRIFQKYEQLNCMQFLFEFIGGKVKVFHILDMRKHSQASQTEIQMNILAIQQKI